MISHMGRRVISRSKSPSRQLHTQLRSENRTGSLVPIQSSPLKNRIDINNYRNSRICSICDNKFTKANPRQNCGFCGHAVCEKHSQHRRQAANTDEDQITCDRCESKAQVEDVQFEYKKLLEAEKEDYKRQEAEVKRLKKKRKERDQFVAASNEEVLRIENDMFLIETELTEKIEEEEQRYKALKAKTATLKSKTEEKDASCATIKSDLGIAKAKAERLAVEVKELEQQMTNWRSQIETYSKQMATRISLDQCKTNCCDDCYGQIIQFFDPENNFGAAERTLSLQQSTPAKANPGACPQSSFSVASSTGHNHSRRKRHGKKAKQDQQCALF